MYRFIKKIEGNEHFHSFRTDLKSYGELMKSYIGKVNGEGF